MIVTYDPAACDWNEVLERAWATRPKGETGMIIAIERGGRMHREVLKDQNRHKKATGESQ